MSSGSNCFSQYQSRKSTVLLALRNPVDRRATRFVEFPCTEVGHFAVLPTILEEDRQNAKKAGWQVSHVGTGFAAITWLRRKRDAIDFARRLEAKGDELGVDWSLTDIGELQKQAAFQELIPIVTEWKVEAEYMP